MVGDDGVSGEAVVVVYAVRFGEHSRAAAAVAAPARPFVASCATARNRFTRSSVVDIVAERAGLTAGGDGGELASDVPTEDVGAKPGHVPVGVVVGG